MDVDFMLTDSLEASEVYVYADLLNYLVKGSSA